MATFTVQEAFTAGRDAFEAGRGRAPALNARFIKLACAEPDTAELLDEYLRGWDRANLDAPVPYSGAFPESAVSQRQKKLT